jgi:hypothetical protein
VLGRQREQKKGAEVGVCARVAEIERRERKGEEKKKTKEDKKRE